MSQHSLQPDDLQPTAPLTAVPTGTEDPAGTTRTPAAPVLHPAPTPATTPEAPMPTNPLPKLPEQTPTTPDLTLVPNPTDTTDTTLSGTPQIPADTSTNAPSTGTSTNSTAAPTHEPDATITASSAAGIQAVERTAAKPSPVTISLVDNAPVSSPTVQAGGGSESEMFEAVTRPRLRSVGGDGEHFVPATTRYAGQLTEGALAVRLQAITRLGVSALPPAPAGAVPGRPDGAQAPLKSVPNPDDTTTSTPDAAHAGTPVEADGGTAAVGAAGTGATAADAAGVPAGRAAVVAGRRGVVREDAPGLPDARLWGGRLAQAVSEVLVGDRPISQLVRFTNDRVFTDLNRRVRLLGMNTTAVVRGAEEKSTVRSVRVFMPERDIAEVAAHVQHGERSRAVALRLEVRRNRWVCTALELG
ncbi:Rv3235 family protein [Kribbella sp. NPDC059898]|uniref:Rv3235 family protein n=1 Tax=Kribbella sp. NPDC059898 TaxID=3346995 RepID=UPI00365E2369